LIDKYSFSFILILLEPLVTRRVILELMFPLEAAAALFLYLGKYSFAYVSPSITVSSLRPASIKDFIETNADASVGNTALTPRFTALYH